MATPRHRASLLALFLSLFVPASARAQEASIDAASSWAPVSHEAAGAASGYAAPALGLSAGLAPTPSLAAPAPVLAASIAPAAAPRTAPAAPSAAAAPFAAGAAPRLAPAAEGAASASSEPGPAESGVPSADASSFDGSALFDGSRLQANDRTALIISGYRFSDAGRLLAPKTGQPLTNDEVRSLQNYFRESRVRRTLLRLAGGSGPDSSPESKAALLGINRDALPREVLKASEAGPENAAATIRRRLAGLYSRWIERATGEPGEAVVEPPNAETEEKLGALISAAVVKRFSEDPEGVRLLDQLRDKQGKLRLPTMRVLRVDKRSGAMYTAHGRQLILNLDDIRPRLIARLPEAERAEAAEKLATESGALEFLLKDPARVSTLAEAIDVTVFHELVHFRQDLERPYFAALGREEIPGLFTFEHEYEAHFRQDLYIHSLLSRPDARPDVDRAADYLRLIDDFEAWRSHIERLYSTDFHNGYVSMDELARLQDDSADLIQDLAGPEDGRSPQASLRLKAAARGKDAVATESRAAKAELAEYRARWPALARDGLRRWEELNEKAGRWPMAALAQERLARRAGSPPDASAWRKKARRSVDLALARIANPEGLGLDERIEWESALAEHFDERGEPWAKEMWTATFRDYAERARELRGQAARASDQSVHDDLFGRARQFELVLRQNRAELRSRAEADLSSVFVETDLRRRNDALARGLMKAEALGDDGLVALFKPIVEDATEADWKREAPKISEKALLRLETGEGLGLDERIAWIDALATYINSRGEQWPRQLWVADLRDVPRKARELRAAAGKAAEGPEKTKLLERARQLEDQVGSNRAALRRDAETNLAALRAEIDPSRRAALIEQGSMQAEALGDEALVSAFETEKGLLARMKAGFKSGPAPLKIGPKPPK